MENHQPNIASRVRLRNEDWGKMYFYICNKTQFDIYSLLIYYEVANNSRVGWERLKRIIVGGTVSLSYISQWNVGGGIFVMCIKVLIKIQVSHT